MRKMHLTRLGLLYSQEKARISAVGRQILRDFAADLCCSEEEEIRVEAANKIAVFFSTESPEAWADLWGKIFQNFQR